MVIIYINIYNLPNVLYKSATKLLLFFGIRKSFVHFFTFFVVFFLETYRKVSKKLAKYAFGNR